MNCLALETMPKCSLFHFLYSKTAMYWPAFNFLDASHTQFRLVVSRVSVSRQAPWQKHHGRTKLLRSWQTGSRQEKNQTERGRKRLGTGCTLKECHPPPNSTLSCKLIDGSIHWLGLCFSDLITFSESHLRIHELSGGHFDSNQNNTSFCFYHTKLEKEAY